MRPHYSYKLKQSLFCVKSLVSYFHSLLTAFLAMYPQFQDCLHLFTLKQQLARGKIQTQPTHGVSSSIAHSERDFRDHTKRPCFAAVQPKKMCSAI